MIALNDTNFLTISISRSLFLRLTGGGEGEDDDEEDASVGGALTTPENDCVSTSQISA